MEQGSTPATILSKKTVMGLPVRKEFIFTNQKGVEKKGIKNRQIKLLKKLEFLARFLKPEEQILCVTTACSPTSLTEQFTTASLFYYLKRALLVFTNKRIFHVLTTPRFRFRHSIAQIRFNDCQNIDMAGGTLTFDYKNGKSENFLYINRKERGKIRRLLKKIKNDGPASRHQGRYYICPSCAGSLNRKQYVCPRCKLEFKSRGRGLWLSLLFTGGGYFYTRHWLFGMANMIIEIGIVYFIILSLAKSIVAGEEVNTIELSLMTGIFITAKLISFYHVSQYINEFIPVSVKYRRRSSTKGIK